MKVGRRSSTAQQLPNNDSQAPVEAEIAKNIKLRSLFSVVRVDRQTDRQTSLHRLESFASSDFVDGVACSQIRILPRDKKYSVADCEILN